MQVFCFRNRPDNTSFHFLSAKLCMYVWTHLRTRNFNQNTFLRCISVTETHDADMLTGATFATPNVFGPRCREIWFPQSENELNTMNWTFINPWDIGNYGRLVLKWVSADTSTHLKVRADGVLWAYTQGMTHDGKDDIQKLASLEYLTRQKV